MKELVPVVSDDLDMTEKGIRTPADSEASLGFMGQWYELDLTEKHYMELSELVNRWIAAGRPTDEPASRRLKPGKPLGVKMADYARYRAWHFATYGAQVEKKKDNQGYKYDPRRVARWRAWEAEHGPYGETKKELARGGPA